MAGIISFSGVRERQDLQSYFKNTKCLDTTGCVKPDSENVTTLEKGKLVGVRPGGGVPAEIDANKIVGFEQYGASYPLGIQTQIYTADENGKPKPEVIYMAPLSAVVAAYSKALDL